MRGCDCGRCTGADERPAPVLCDGCGFHEIDPDDYPENSERLCAKCETARDEAARDEAADRRRDELWWRR